LKSSQLNTLHSQKNSTFWQPLASANDLPEATFRRTKTLQSFACILFLAVSVFGFKPALDASQNDQPQIRHGIMPEAHFELLENHCLDCHDAFEEKGGVNLEDLSFTMDTLDAAELWQKVLNVVNSGEMPPEDEPPLAPEDKTEFLADLSNQLVVARDALSDSGGVITMRRLNLREYENTIESLLGVQIDASDLPDDSNPGGFDTNGSALYFSSDQFEQYLKIAGRALDLALVEEEKPQVRKVRIEAEELQLRRVKQSVGNIARDYLAEEYPEIKSVQDLDFVTMAKGLEARPNYRWKNYEAYFEDPNIQDGAVLYNFFNDFSLGDFTLPPDSVARKYLIRVRVALLDENVPEHRRYIEYGSAPSGVKKGEMSVYGARKVNATMADPEIIEMEFVPSNSGRRTLRIRERSINSLNAAKRFFRDSDEATGKGPPPAMWVDWVEWEGPLIEQWPSESQAKLFVPRKKGQSEEAYHRSVLQNFAERAFRTKAPSRAYVDKLMSLYRGAVESGSSPRDALKEQLAIVLASPGFIYLNEPVHGEDQRELNDRELAVRLSYFLWSSPPDEELKRLASSGRLMKPKVLEKQVQRMLSDPKSDEFVSGFAHQWLHMERLDFFQFNYQKYPMFDDSIKEAARHEVYATLRNLIEEDRSIGELLKSDHVLVNDLLANYYGIEGVDGDHFRRVPVPEGSPRGGLLGMAAVLAMGSDGERSSPVERGAWVLRKLLHDAPPPAPANVPQLSRFEGDFLSARVLGKAHQEEPQCAQCHRKIDPIGYGLENFDAVGLWRDEEIVRYSFQDFTDREKADDKDWRKKAPPTLTVAIDPSGELFDGTPFENFYELRDRIAERESDFARGFTEHLIEYALGRPFGFVDYNLADSILEKAAEKDYAMNAFILGVVQSDRFKLK